MDSAAAAADDDREERTRWPLVVAVNVTYQSLSHLILFSFLLSLLLCLSLLPLYTSVHHIFPFIFTTLYLLLTTVGLSIHSSSTNLRLFVFPTPFPFFTTWRDIIYFINSNNSSPSLTHKRSIITHYQLTISSITFNISNC